MGSSSVHIPYNRELKQRAAKLRKNMTDAEQLLWQRYLRHHTAIFHRQKPLDYFIADFYCSKALLVIEVDGDSHFTDEGQGYDRERTERLARYGIAVIRFTNDEVLKNISGVCQEIERVVQERLQILGKA